MAIFRCLLPHNLRKYNCFLYLVLEWEINMTVKYHSSCANNFGMKGLS